MTLTDYQAAIIEDKSKVVIGGMARRTGKTTTASEIIKGSTGSVLVVVPYMGEAKAIYSLNPKAEVEKVSPTILKMEGSRITFISAENVRHYAHPRAPYQYVIAMEPARISDKLVDGIMEIPSEQTYLLGTPKKLHPFEDLDAFTLLWHNADVMGFSKHHVPITLTDIPYEKLEEIEKHLKEEFINPELYATFSTPVGTTVIA